MRLVLVLVLALAACSSSREAAGPEGEASVEAPSKAAEPPSGSLDSVGDRGTPIPFGFALTELGEAEQQLLFPYLLAAAAPPDALAAALPEELLGLRRGPVTLGVQEDSVSAWVGALATYEGDRGPVTVLVQDTGWEPLSVNRLLGAWSRTGLRLADDRPVADLAPDERDGYFLQAPVEAARPRLVLQVHSPSDAALAMDVLAALPLGPLKPLLDRPPADLPRSPRLPPAAELARLAPPARLLAALPAPPADCRVVAEASGYQREERRDLVAVALRSCLRPDGLVRASLRDLGDPEHPVSVATGGERGGSTSETRQMRGRKGMSCSEELASCKATRLLDDRLAFSIVGPDGARAELERMIGAIDEAAARAALP